MKPTASDGLSAAVLNGGAEQVFVGRKKLRARDPRHCLSSKSTKYKLNQIAGMNAGQFSVLDVLGTANLSGRLDPVLLNGFIPTIGQSFTFLTYAAVKGTLSIFNPNIDNEPEHWVVSYQATNAILTVAPGNVPVPDQGSTFLLLTLGLLGLVAYRRQLLHGQP